MTDAAVPPSTDLAPGLPPPVVSCGDPSGIGPEIAVAARAVLGTTLPFALIGDPAHLPHRTRWQAVDRPEDARHVPPDALPVLVEAFASPAPPGRPDPANAAGVVTAITRGVRLVQSGAASAIVTNPINKKALKDGAGFAFPGHTEFLAHLAGVDRVVMMLACDALRVVPVTIHIPLAQVQGALTRDLLEATLRITRAGLARDFGMAAPRIAVAGLNPHAGEGGSMGDDEARIIVPVLDRLRAEGVRPARPPARRHDVPCRRARGL
jgi:4-hydroxythreonine-4-phosphate dehydrogenase